MGTGIGRCIAAGWKVDAKVAVMRLFGVVLPDSAPHFAGGHPNDRVDGRVVGRLTREDVYAERSLLQRLRRLAERVLDDAFEEETAALAGSKEAALQNAMQLGSNLIRREDVTTLRALAPLVPPTHRGVSHWRSRGAAYHRFRTGAIATAKICNVPFLI